MQIDEKNTRKEDTFCRVVYKDVSNEDFHNLDQVMEASFPGNLYYKLNQWKENEPKLRQDVDKVSSSLLVKYPADSYSTIYSTDLGNRISNMEGRLADILRRVFHNDALAHTPACRIVGDPSVAPGHVEFFFGQDVFFPPERSVSPKWRIKYRVGMGGNWQDVGWNVDLLFLCYAGFYPKQQGAVILGGSRHPFSLDKQTADHIMKLGFQCIRIFLQDGCWHIISVNKQGRVPTEGLIKFKLNNTGTQVIAVFTNQNAAVGKDLNQQLLQLWFVQLDQYGNEISAAVPDEALQAEKIPDERGTGDSPMLSARNSYLHFRGILLPPHHCGVPKRIESWELRFDQYGSICKADSDVFSLSLLATDVGLYLKKDGEEKEKLDAAEFQACGVSLTALPKDVDSNMNIGLLTCGGKREYLVTDRLNLRGAIKTFGRAQQEGNYQLDQLILGPYSLHFVNNTPPAEEGLQQFNTYCVSRVQAKLTLDSEEQELTVKQESSTHPIYVFDSDLQQVEKKLGVKADGDAEAVVVSGQYVALGRYLFEFAGKV